METATAQQLNHGIEQFNEGEFYACHDTLEALWMEANEPDRTFFQGLLQVAVGLYHLSNHNWQGAVTLLGNGINRLRPYTPEYATVDVVHLLDWSTALLQQLQQAGPEAIADHPLAGLGPDARANSAGPNAAGAKQYSVCYCTPQ